MERIRIALIPAYEPDWKIFTVLKECLETGIRCIVVDDGSGSRFDSIFENLPPEVMLLRFPENRGKGAALKAGLRYIEEHFKGEYSIVTLDCDGQHQVRDALRLLRAAEKERGSLFLGSRRQSRSSPLRSRIGNAITRAVFSLISGTRIYDTQTGLRAFTERLLPRLLEIRGDRYEYEMNMLLLLAREKLTIREIPIETIYFENNRGSHFDSLKDSIRIYGQIFRFGMSSLFSFLLDFSLYSLLLGLFGLPAVLAYGLARLVSAGVNFSINRRLVFHSEKGLLRSAARYALLAAGILLLNSIILSALLMGLHMHPFPAKLLTELLLFSFSYLVQQRLIFSDRKTSAEAGKPEESRIEDRIEYRIKESAERKKTKGEDKSYALTAFYRGYRGSSL